MKCYEVQAYRLQQKPSHARTGCIRHAKKGRLSLCVLALTHTCTAHKASTVLRLQPMLHRDAQASIRIPSRPTACGELSLLPGSARRVIKQHTCCSKIDYGTHIDNALIEPFQSLNAHQARCVIASPFEANCSTQQQKAPSTQKGSCLLFWHHQPSGAFRQHS
jgi:hypothetical protein